MKCYCGYRWNTPTKPMIMR
jgi:hypothetical protein